MTERSSILFVNQFYCPDVAATGQYLSDLAEHMARLGYEVHVLCASGRYERGDIEQPARDWRNGVYVRRLSTSGLGRYTYRHRLADYVSYFVQVTLRILLRRPYDQVVFLTTPPLLALAGLPARWFRGRRYGIWSMDLHPEAEVSIGMFGPQGKRTRVLRFLSRLTYRWADFVVPLGPYMGRRLHEAGVPQTRMEVVPLWNVNGTLEPLAYEDNPLVDELGLQGKFVVLYSGNAGLVHRFDEVLEAMRRLRDHERLHFLFVGNGLRRVEIERFIRIHDLHNASYLDYFPFDRLQESLSLGHVHLCTLINEAAGVAVPSKVWSAMAIGRPVLMVGPEESEPGEVILRHGFGQVFDPERHDDVAGDLAQALLELEAAPDRRRALGARAREAYLKHYRRDLLCDRWARLLHHHLNGRSATTEPGREEDADVDEYRPASYSGA